MAKTQTPPPVRRAPIRQWYAPPRGVTHTGTHARELVLTLRSKHNGEDPTPPDLQPEAVAEGFKLSDAAKRYRVLVGKLREAVEEIESLEVDRQALEADITKPGNPEQLAEIVTNLEYLRPQEAAYRKAAEKAREEAVKAARDFAGGKVDAAHKAAFTAREKTQRELLRLLESNEILNRYSDAVASLDKIKLMAPTVTDRLLASIDELPQASPEPAEA